MTPLVSIIIPVYNRAEVVKRTLDTVAAQTCRPLQLILVDNNSTDGTRAALDAFADEHRTDGFETVVVDEARQTAGAARNRGLREAKGEWLMFFDSDDEMAPDLVASYLAAAESAGDCDLVCTGGVRRLKNGGNQTLPLFKTDLIANHILHAFLATQRYMVSRDLIDAAGQWNPGLVCWNDWEMGLRLLLAEPKVAFVTDKVRVFVNDSGAASITGTDYATLAPERQLTLDAMAADLDRAEGSPRLRRLLDYRRLVLAALYRLEGRDDLASPLRDDALRRLRDSYGNSLRWRLWTGPVVRLLYTHIARGGRGAARVARVVVR